MPKHDKNHIELLKTWVLPPAATLGSSVRMKGILLEIRARLPHATKKSLNLDGRELTLMMPASEKAEFHAASAVVVKALVDIETLPVIPREIEDILTIKTSERHRWLADGRLPSAGTRTVKLRGRARKITFHVFDPRVVGDILDRGVVEDWREEDAAAAAENRRRAAYKAKLTRTLRNTTKGGSNSETEHGDAASNLAGWEEFGRDGLLR
ncbi:hypothetical protein HR059_11160 [Sinorhizobium meliloti WSM1022]|jgi:hypothetical protein|uniref:hypothetical protein n=1 Tax=Rhizobium meliloti TaxID=382 RepID=UPI0004139EB8|nr:hypothetical protein [Sinorhizobium meliloti]ASQ03367.1 hypothetical protein CDO23_05065 [Sinorhizobium meliloti]MCO6425838.1 hypothetical protein [Sinorhizobium meliloti]MDW9407738.1 hypothetical protein [Sinorhizobium meliloti]MDW9444984.1 hypothetical protein [Sinorhizobium meliloti]MDW9452916.1 hypothetical protein [Sinorhizobium meliloti]